MKFLHVNKQNLNWNEKFSISAKKQSVKLFQEYGIVGLNKRNVSNYIWVVLKPNKKAFEEKIALINNLIEPIIKKKNDITKTNSAVHDVVLRVEEKEKKALILSKSTITPQESPFLNKYPCGTYIDTNNNQQIAGITTVGLEYDLTEKEYTEINKYINNEDLNIITNNTPFYNCFIKNKNSNKRGVANFR